MTEWEKFLNRRNANIGFRTRTNALREPTAEEKELALALESKSWQESIGKKSFKVSEEYLISKGIIPNLDEELKEANRLRAIMAFVDTPMELVGKFKDRPVDLSIYTKPRGKIRKFIDWILRRPKVVNENLKERLSWIEIIRLTNKHESKGDKIK